MFQQLRGERPVPPLAVIRHAPGTRRIGDDRPRLNTNFDSYVSPEENRENLRREAIEHFTAVLAQYEQRYHQLRSEVIYAERVLQVTGTLSSDTVSASLEELRELRNRITSQLLSDEASRMELTESITCLRDALAEMTSTAQTFITKRPPTGKSEGELLHIIQETAVDWTRGAELKEVILKLVADDPDFELDEVMRDLQSLFKKNQVILRIQPRR